MPSGDASRLIGARVDAGLVEDGPASAPIQRALPM
jgi:hypothetical protein